MINLHPNKLARNIFLFILCVLAIGWAVTGLDLNSRMLSGGLRGLYDFIKLSFPLDFSILPSLINPFFQTFQIAIISIFFSTLFGLIIAPFAASNLIKNKILCQMVKTLLGILRGVPPLLYALIFVATVGLGPLAGALGLILHCTGAIGRFFSEAMEAVNMSAIESMKIDGANKFQVYIHGVIPGCGEYIVGYILYYFEYCIRTSTILGLVGAGGLGYKLISDMRLFRYDRAVVTFLVILAVIIIIDRISLLIRKSFIKNNF